MKTFKTDPNVAEKNLVWTHEKNLIIYPGIKEYFIQTKEYLKLIVSPCAPNISKL